MTGVTEKILFTCGGCGYKARIPGHYAGRSIHCPQCKSVQQVPAVEEAGGAVASDAPTQDSPTSDPVRSGKIVFACTSCSYKGRLSSEYDGKTIRCPGCQTAQVVKGKPVTSTIVASMAADEPVFKGMEGDKVRFSCASCGYRARIPSKYAGKPIHCPQCKKVEMVKPEADLEASTGKTVSISRISSVEVKEPRLAMTNVGVQFMCAVCGYESRISPSCVGDAIYCPKCRSPQKVEWSDPNAPKPDSARSALESKPAPAIAAKPDLESAPISLEVEPVESAATASTVLMPPSDAPKLPIAKTSGSSLEDEGIVGDITDIRPMLTAPIAPKPSGPPRVSKQGGRRVITAAPRDGESAAVAPAALAEAPSAAPDQESSGRASEQARKRRSVVAPAKPADVEKEEEEDTAKAPPLNRKQPVAPSVRVAPASKLPLIASAAVAVLLLALTGMLYLQMKSLKATVDTLTALKAKSETEALQVKKDAEAAAAAAATAQAEVERRLKEAQDAASAAQAELDKLKAATPEAPAVEEAKPAVEEKPPGDAGLPP